MNNYEKSSFKLKPIFLVLLALFSTVIACGGNIKMDDVEQSGSPQPFDSIGEMTPYWELELKPKAIYEVTVKPPQDYH